MYVLHVNLLYVWNSISYCCSGQYACRYQNCCNRQPDHNRRSVRNEKSHDECHAKVASTNHYFIFAPLSFRNSQEDPNPTNQCPVRHTNSLSLAAIVFGTYTLASLIWLQVSSTLILRPCRFGCHRLRRPYFGLADLASIAFATHTSVLPVTLQSSSALILRPC